MALNVAQRHAVKYWPYAMNALDDGRLELATTWPSGPLSCP